MRLTSRIHNSDPSIMPMNKMEEDLFLDIFTQDHIRIIKAMEKKKEAVGYIES